VSNTLPSFAWEYRANRLRRLGHVIWYWQSHPSGNGHPPPMEWTPRGSRVALSRKKPLFSMIRGQTHQGPDAVEDSVLNTRYVPVVPDAHKPNGKSRLGTDVNCPEKLHGAWCDEAKMPRIVASRESRSLEIKAYISRVPWQRSTYSKFGALRSTNFEARFLSDPSTLFVVCRVRVQSVHPITNHQSNVSRRTRAIMRKAIAYLGIVRTDL